MALLTAGQVIQRTQALLDDPAGRRFSPDYLRPYVDQENEEMQIFLELIGVQQQESIAIFNVPAATQAPLDLTPYFQPNQPLQYFLSPRRIDWKVQGQPDVSYTPSAKVAELDDVQVGNVGCQQYRWGAASLQLTPSYTPVTLRIYFWSLSQVVYDSASDVMRGIGHILALRTAAFVASMNNNMGKLAEALAKKQGRAERNFGNLLVMQSQAQLLVPRGTKRGGAAQMSAGGVPYI